MVDDPYTYDLTDFAREFTWAVVFWNLAESSARDMLVILIGETLPAKALVVDMGNRSLCDGLRSAGRQVEDAELRDHIDHFVTGFDRLLGYRNLYVHGLMAVGLEREKGNVRILNGHVLQLKGRGRLRAEQRPVPISEITEFKERVMKLLDYAKAILRQLGQSDFGLGEMLGMPEPSLEKPQWPATVKNSPHYLQD